MKYLTKPEQSRRVMSRKPAKQCIRSDQQREVYCALCKKNGETEAVFKTHKLRDENDQVVCPVLRQYTCPKCSVVGEHTVSYCPENKQIKKGTVTALNRSSPNFGSNLMKTSSTMGSACNQQSIVSSLKISPSQIRPSRQQDFVAKPRRYQTLLQPLINGVSPRRDMISESLMPHSKHLSISDSFLALDEPTILPPINRPGASLSQQTLIWLLSKANLMNPTERLGYLYKHGYNIARFQAVQRIVLTWKHQTILHGY